MSNVEAQKDNNGEIRIAHKLNAEDFEKLKVLNTSEPWRLYRQTLVQAKEAYVNSMLQMKDPNEMVKMIGMIGGMNYAINNVAVLCAEYDRVQKEKVEKAKKEKQPLVRG